MNYKFLNFDSGCSRIQVVLDIQNLFLPVVIFTERQIQMMHQRCSCIVCAKVCFDRLESNSEKDQEICSKKSSLVCDNPV